MFKWLGVAATAASLALLSAMTQSAPTYFKLSSNPAFAKYRPALVDYLRGQHYRSATRFCLFGRKDGSGAIATIIWPDGQQIIDWGGNDAALADATSIVHLKTDVVPTENDLHGSTYLVTRQWVEDQQTICKQQGVTVQIGVADLKP